MRELDIKTLLSQDDKIEVTQEQEQEYKLVYHATIVPHSGHTLFQIDPESMEITEAEYAVRDYIFNPHWKKGDPIPSHGEVVMKQGMVYVSALNKRNALKKFQKGSDGTKLDLNKIYLDL